MRDAGDQRAEAGDGEKDAEHDGPVVGSTAGRPDRRHEIGVVVIETALHLIEESLLLL